MPRSPSLLHVVSPLMSSAPPTILRFDMAAMAAVPDVGFDVVAAKIRSIQYDYCPVYGTATGALIRSSRHLKESFTKGAGKRVVDASDTTAPASRRRAVAVTPSLGVPLEPSYSTPFPSRFAASPSSAFTQSPLRAMLIDQRDGLVSHHAPRRASVLQHVYRRMRPEEIVRMSPGDEIIVVIPGAASQIESRYCRCYRIENSH
jgi:hypothetical protein